MSSPVFRVLTLVAVVTSVAFGASWLRGRRATDTNAPATVATSGVATDHGLAGTATPSGSNAGPVSDGAGDPVLASLTRRLSAPEFGVRADALVRLRTRGPRAASAAPAVIAVLGDGDPRLNELVALTLAAFGEDACAAVDEALASDDVRVRAGVLRALERFDTLSPRAVAALRRGLVDPEEAVRAAAVTAWAGHAGRASDETVLDLVARLDDAAPRVRATAATTLGRLAISPDVTVPALARLVTRAGESDATRLEAVWAIARVRATSAEAALALAAAVRDGSPAVAREARRALRLLGPSAIGAADALYALAVAADDAGRVELVATLASIVPARTDVTALLAESIRAGDGASIASIRGLLHAGDAGIAVLEALASDPAGGPVVSAAIVESDDEDRARTRGALTRLLASPSDALVDLALRSLSIAGNDAKDCVGAVVAAMRHVPPTRTLAFARTLGEIGDGSAAAAAALLDVARAGDPATRAEAVRGLGYVGVWDPAVEAFLRAAAAGGDPVAARDARRALSRLGHGTDAIADGEVPAPSAASATPSR